MNILIKSIFSMSMYGSIAILAVLIFRFLFRRLPKKITVLLWLVAALRLVCPLNFKSSFSFFNLKIFKAKESFEEVSAMAPSTTSSHIDKKTLEYARYIMDNYGKADHSAEVVKESLSIDNVMFFIWAIGVMIIVSVMIIRAVRIILMLKGGRKTEGKNYYETNLIDTPFVVGVVKPRIWLPFGIESSERDYILLHETIHILKHDNIMKLLGMGITCIHWFNPLVWLAYRLFCSDLEMRCDEEVIRLMGDDIKKSYCTSIVCRAMKQKRFGILPESSFTRKTLGGMEVKMRINNLINKKQAPKVVAIGLSLLAVGAVAAFSSSALASEKNDTATVKAEEVTTEEATIEGAAIEGATIEGATIEETTPDADTSTEQVDVKEEKVDLVPEKAPEEAELPLADTPSQDEEAINHGYENYIIPEGSTLSDEGMVYTDMNLSEDCAILMNAIQPYLSEGFVLNEEPQGFIDEEGNEKEGYELYTVFFNNFVEGEHYYCGMASLKSENYTKDFFDEADLKNGVYEKEITIVEGLREYRSYNPETNVFICITYMEGDYAVGDDPSEPVEY